MGLFDKEPFDPAKRHYELDFNDTKTAIICTKCGKVLEERDSFPDYIGFMGGVFVKQNLPCIGSPEALPSQDGLEVSEEPMPKSINRNQE